jgi:PAS domain S-box-containing protein
MKFLIIDSDSVGREKTVGLLREAYPTAQLVEVVGSADYHRALQGDAVDLVLTDQTLDWGAGLTVVREARSRWPDVPAILVTALGGEELLLAALRAGIDDYVSKDRLEELVPAVERHLADGIGASVQRQGLAHALELERGRLAAILDHLPVGVWIADANGQLVGKNREADRIWAGDAPLAESIEDYPQYQAWDAETGERLQPEAYPVAIALQTGQEVGPVELHVRRFDGSEGDVLVSATPIKGDRGRMAGVVSINVDITDRKRAENVLRESEAKYRAVFDSLVEGVVFLNTEGEVEEANDAVRRLHGHTLNELADPELDPRGRIVRPDGSLFPEEEQPAMVALRTGQAVRDVEMGVPTRDGRLRWRLVNAQPVRDEHGTLLGAVASFFDITDRKHGEEALRESEEKFRFMAMNIPDTLFFQDLDLRYIWIFNPAGPFKASDIVGKTDADLLPAEEADMLTRIKRQVIETGEEMRVELQLSPGGTTRWYEAVYEPSHDAAGQIVGIVTYSRDITERKAAEAERERLLAENRHQRELLTRVLEAVPAGIAVIRGPEFRCELANSAVRALPGLPDASFVGRTVDEVFPEPVAQALRDILGQVFATDETVSVRELEGPEEMGADDTYWDIDYVPLHDAQDQVSGVLVVAHQVTEHVLLLRDLRRRAAELNAVLESIADGVLVYGPHAQIRRMNPAAQAMLQYSPAVQEQGLDGRIKSTRPKRADGTPYTTGTTPVVRALSGETVRGEVMALWYAGAEEPSWVSASAAPIVTETGQMLGAVATFTNITALMKAQEEAAHANTQLAYANTQLAHANVLLTEQATELETQAAALESQNVRLARVAEHLTAEQARLRATLSALPVAVVIADAEGRLIERNARFFDLWSEDAPAITGAEGSAAYKGWWADNGERLRVEDWPLWRALHGGDVVTGEAIDIEQFDGTCGTMLNSAAPIRDEGERIIGAVAVMLDITERRRAEATLRRYTHELETLDQANRTLLQEINHRVKNTLTAILGLIYTERGRVDSADGRDALGDLAERVRSLAAAHTLLSASGWRPLELDTLAADVIEAAAPIALETERVIDVHPSCVRVTPGQAHNLALVLGELTTNTAKYGRNSGRLEIVVDVVVANGEVCLTYRDSGPGYPAPVLAGTERSVGLGLVNTIVTHSLRGGWSIRNDDGAVTEVRFPVSSDLCDAGSYR